MKTMAKSGVSNNGMAAKAAKESCGGNNQWQRGLEAGGMKANKSGSGIENRKRRNENSQRRKAKIMKNRRKPESAK
jgi:hypothetical protein